MSKDTKKPVTVSLSAKTRREVQALAIIRSESQGDVLERAAQRELQDATSPTERAAIRALAEAMEAPRR